ncbi:glycosyltransferase family 2 protein [Thermothelomyces thermophilus ATCC 42464]|uniref:chitin synthase n=1 Tax=Thermothelomyces thermophilus (strain ATCC 42464 / BCRC 31852 / DSM 1799) TaxID=573729 RepID=G2Q5R4_THET4|nr:glycosyltransferase family 2 protein [Thermothelomyces thermophilus ATCC 42464]AEO55500.1 glycosyltransferase family 2 protein [Thermothelomyces thermophilus ATCC 42464]
MANRMSVYSMASEPGMGGSRGGQQSQVSSTTLLNSIHNSYLSSQPYQLDAGTSLVVNTWLTASQPGPTGHVGGTVDANLITRAWEHARRRAEDGCIILGKGLLTVASSLHTSTPSLLRPALSSLPVPVPSSVFQSLQAIEPLLRCVTPYNPSTPRQVALGVTLTLNLAGKVVGASVALSQGGIDTEKGLLRIPAEPGHRAFDAFYYLLTSASTPAEREFLGLKGASSYNLLARSGTYDPPSYLPTADDGTAADDFRSALKEIGIKGSAHRNFISTLAGLLKLGDTVDYHVDEDVLEEVSEDVSGLLGLEPEVLSKKCTTDDRATLLAGMYEALVDWVIRKANEAIAAQVGRIRDGEESADGSQGGRTPNSAEDTGDTVCLHFLEIPDPNLGKAVAMQGVFDDNQGINSEMKQDGLEVAPASSSVLREMQNAVAEAGPELGITVGSLGRDRQHMLEKREEVLERIALAAEEDGFLKQLLIPVPAEGITLGRGGRIDLSALLSTSRAWYHLCIHPTDESPASLAALPSVNSAWSAGTVSRQLRAWRLPEWSNRRNKQLDYTVDFDFDEFVARYRMLGCTDGRDGIESWVLERGWANGDVVVGRERVWMREHAWWEAECALDMSPAGAERLGSMPNMMPPTSLGTGYSATGSGFFPPQPFHDASSNGSREQLVHQRNLSQATLGGGLRPAMAPSIAPTGMTGMRNTSNGDYGLGTKGDTHRGDVYYNADGQFVGLDADLAEGKKITEQPISTSRRAWVTLVWILTFWIPSPLLKYVGRMKRPDVRMAWREKFVLCFIIALLNGILVFWIILFGKLLCPDYDKAWSRNEVSHHLGENDFWVSIHGKVYDISKFWKIDHGTPAYPSSREYMEPLAGMDLSNYFIVPLTLVCPGLVTDPTVQLTLNTSLEYSIADHTSGHYARDPTGPLGKVDWYSKRFLPRMKPYFTGELVWEPKQIKQEGDDYQRPWFLWENRVYDLTDYMKTQEVMRNNARTAFLHDKIVSAVKENPGQDLTDTFREILDNANATEAVKIKNTFNCLNNRFYIGITDYRQSARCQFNRWILIAFTAVLCAVILIKFVSALQFGSKRRPAPQDKFVICQVPAYTEGEDSLRKALDSLTALQYDNKRKLICVICDGIVVGGGNDRPTPKIVLDILGVDPKVDPPALPFKSVGMGSEQLNYGKVYSGLYEYEGNVVPYLVVVKVGKESEREKTKPGNRGKRDSQILLLSFLNRVHHRAPMNPLELEMFHHINNIIGVDPELYEYLLMVDADTCVREDSLNRLVAACAADAKIAGICGETSLQNEERSWWTMIQVYEYYISHHLAKAFESLFGSVTCLPGCFCMYRLRTADKGKPLIISDDIIREYSDCNVDTLHKKNLLSLGEDRYLTTLMTKYFPYMSYKFIPDAYCQTAAPEKWSVLLSQRRRWINSTIHNLVELMFLPEMCGFCFFSMRFIVFVDLIGTVMLPATCVYLGWLLYTVITRTGPFPLISIVMLAAVYGLQALIFILKRQWQHIGWMIIYILAFPVYFFILPIYSFWNQDNFTWGNTRIVIGESGKKQVVAVDDEGFDPRSIPLQRWDDYALANNLPGRRGGHSEKYGMDGAMGMYEENYEMDDMKSVYSSVRQPSVLNLPGRPGAGAYMPPTPGTPFTPGAMTRTSTLLGTTPYTDNPNPAHRQSMMSMGTMGGGIGRSHTPYADFPGGATNSRLSMASASPSRLGLHPDLSTGSFGGGGMGSAGGVVDDAAIIEAIQSVLREVDLDTVTKKQVRALVEQRLQTELTGERRTFMDRQIDNELANM